MSTTEIKDLEARLAENEPSYEQWETLKDVVDEMIDLMLNYRQSGHPGGSRSKVHAMLALLLSGGMRWDIRRPWRPFCDRFVLSAGHTIPLVYACLAVLNEVMRARHALDPDDERFVFPDGGKYALTWEDLLTLRRNGGLPGHAEMEGKTLFLKWNTGPSGHGMPAAAGEAAALKLAGAGEVKVFALEGEGGLTPGASHETKNSAWGLGLDNLVFLVDWNDFGIDDNAISSVVHGSPELWFKPYGWKVTGTEHGSEWPHVTRAVLEAARGENAKKVPSIAWFKTRKGRGYLKYDNHSHGAAHPMNSEPFWQLRKGFMERHGVEYQGVDAPAPEGEARTDQATANFEIAMSVLRRDEKLIRAISDRLAELAESVPDRIDGFRLGGKGAEIFSDERLYDYENYPEELYARPGDSQPNRAALATWGAWVNSLARKDYDRPLFLACSADLAASTNIIGFSKGHGDVPGWGWYERDKNPEGTLLPQQITEFTNAGICVGIASVNMADDPMRSFNGFWSACSTYGSFSYLKYGMMRLYSQLAQDCDLPVGKVIWVAGHSGPETAEDSRTHFGIFSPGVTQLFPDGHVIDLHPWEYNEVPVVLGAALKQKAAIVALHLTRPKVTIPDREALGMASHFEAAKGAYVLRRFKEGERHGTIFVQGTSTTNNLVQILPELDKAGLNVKIVAAISPQLFALQSDDYKNEVASTADRWDAMVITNRSLRVTSDWIAHPIVAEYSMSSDWDDRWRTGGSVDEVIDEAHLSGPHLLAGIERFVRERGSRLKRLREAVEAADKH